ncbi:hypothetical protein P153DRAFT_149259 [Dothidotthia symphoricarpi CBS 119687]|uniref:Uncharacterized protein n=1 Tax=Dothidotthia symphoricarpi CBS 119687 TaxID=1392245 RepID=A0A6A5ZYW7_9PLEO|nr:uncharacterized protein P153DRAFT_149259 [Dothidotthia symphoricarpi CBS 119687]KAF2123598.1 hypothetical protein P153DRAFT_149259 [Dothidotthia symphoricarpi CBS 119687]
MGFAHLIEIDAATSTYHKQRIPPPHLSEPVPKLPHLPRRPARRSNTRKQLGGVREKPEQPASRQPNTLQCNLVAASGRTQIMSKRLLHLLAGLRVVNLGHDSRSSPSRAQLHECSAFSPPSSRYAIFASSQQLTSTALRSRRQPLHSHHNVPPVQ